MINSHNATLQMTFIRRSYKNTQKKETSGVINFNYVDVYKVGIFAENELFKLSLPSNGMKH